MPLLRDAPGLGDVPINVPRLTALSIRDARPRIPEYRHSCLYACVPSAPVSEASHQKKFEKIVDWSV